jgi:hypothetical protein
MSREEISEMLLKQQAVNKFGKAEYDQKVELYKQYLKEGKLDKFKEEQGQATYDMMKDQLSNQEQMGLVQEKMGDQMQQLVQVIKPISDAFVSMSKTLALAANAMNTIVKAFTYLTGLKIVQWLMGGGAKTAATNAAESVLNTVKNTTGPNAAAELTKQTGGSLSKQAMQAAGVSVVGKEGKNLFGQAATSALKKGTATLTSTAAPGATSAVGAAAAEGGGGFFKNLKGGISNTLSGLKTTLTTNPVTSLKEAFKGMGGAGNYFKKVAGGAGIGALIEGLFAHLDIAGMIAANAGQPKSKIAAPVGKRVSEGIGSMAGGALIGALLSPIPGGTIIGGMLGSMAGKYIGGMLGEDAEGLGNWALDTFYKGKMKEADIKSLDKGGVIKESGLVHADKGEVYTGSETIDLFKGMYNEMKAQNEILMNILRKDTTLVVDNQVMAKATGRAAVTSYGNVLNNPKLH